MRPVKLVVREPLLDDESPQAVRNHVEPETYCARRESQSGKRRNGCSASWPHANFATQAVSAPQMPATTLASWRFDAPVPQACECQDCHTSGIPPWVDRDIKL